MRYSCLVLDHDDTIVGSTRQIHHPCFMEYLKIIRPGVSMTFEEYMMMNFQPGFVDFCFKVLNFTEDEMKEEVVFWNKYVKTHVPIAYEGISDLLHRFKNDGGIICVVSHSLSENILRDYRENELPVPDEVYGWERPENERKPSPFPIMQIMEKYKLQPDEILMVDDLKPGYDMAKKCNIDFAAAGWAYEHPEIKSFMLKNSDYYLRDVKDLESVVFGKY